MVQQAWAWLDWPASLEALIAGQDAIMFSKSIEAAGESRVREGVQDGPGGLCQTKCSRRL